MAFFGVFVYDFWKPIPEGATLHGVRAWEDFWSIPHSKAMHGRSRVVCSNCWDVLENHEDTQAYYQHIEDSYEQEQREIFDLNRLLDADDPFAQERSEDLEEADSAPVVQCWRVCESCSLEFEIPEHLARALQEREIPLICPTCLIFGRN